MNSCSAVARLSRSWCRSCSCFRSRCISLPTRHQTNPCVYFAPLPLRTPVARLASADPCSVDHMNSGVRHQRRWPTRPQTAATSPAARAMAMHVAAPDVQTACQRRPSDHGSG
jgi:hypothetical protein